MLVLPLLASCLGHPERSVGEILQRMVHRLLEHYPQQVMWAMLVAARVGSFTNYKLCIPKTAGK